MSRVGKRKIDIPSGVQVTIEPSRVLVQGPRGKIETAIPDRIVAEMADDSLLVLRKTEDKISRSLHGLTRSLLANAVAGVTEGFQKGLDVVGIGYRVQVEGNSLKMSLGFSHTVEVAIPEGIQIKVERSQSSIANYIGTIIVSGNNKQQVGQVAADIRRLRPPDSYKGKGIRYTNELVRLKVGKKGA